MLGLGANRKKSDSSRGYSSILVLALIPVTLILVGSLADMALVSRRQVIINKNLVGYSALLDAAIDYTIYAIKNRWCMTGNWDKNSSCSILDSRNLERMTLDTKAVTALRDIYFSTGELNSLTVDIKTLEGIIEVDKLVADHPLNAVIKSLQDTGSVGINKIRITVNRVDSNLIPQRGRESHLEIIASIEGSATIFRGLSTLTARSRIIVHPRELNYFSLVVANNLYLSRGNNGNTPGDFYISTIAGAAGSNGVNFQSPVFANGNIVIPTGNSKSPAVFNQRVVLGGRDKNGSGGQVVTEAGPMSPDTPGDPKDQVYGLLETYSGLRRGVDVDGVRDSGLDIFAGLSVKSDPDIGQYNICRDFAKKRSDLRETALSDLLIQQIANPQLGGGNGTTDTYQYRLALNEGNYFFPQEVFPTFEPTTNGEGGLASRKGSSILRFVVTAGSTTHAFLLSRENNAKLRYVDPVTGKSGQINITTTPVLDADGKIMPEFNNITISASRRKTAIPSPITIRYYAFDVGTFGGRDRRDTSNLSLDSGHGRDGVLTFNVSSTGDLLAATGVPMAPTYTKNSQTPAGMMAPPLGDIRKKMDLCNEDTTSDTVSSNPFKIVDWNTNFTENTRFSWHFAPVAGSNETEYQSIPALSNTIIGDSAGTDGFKVVSISGTCVVPPTTTFIAGFYTCDSFVISPRLVPLTIVGTIIAGKGFIDNSAAQAGVTFRSIYHPQATMDLRSHNILQTFDNTTCPSVMPFPVWWPTLTEKDTYTLRNCNAVSIRDKADPFTWTTVDPDCGLTSKSTYVQCKHRATRLLVREISRESDLQ